MTKRHVYFGIENLALNDQQKATLVDALKQLGPKSHSQPACLMHWRIRLDGDAAIFEALFEEDAITVDAIRQYLANVFGIDAQNIGDSVSFVTLDSRETAVVRYSYAGTDYLQLAVFGYAGGEWPTWSESGDEVRAYLAANREQWESEE